VKTIKIKTYADIPQNYTGIVVFPDGRKYWFLNGLLHREDGPAAVYPNGIECWYLNGELHREDGPAIVYTVGEKQWYLNDKQVGKKTVELYYMLKHKKVLKL
jgi:hypothetical protein